MKLTMNMTTNKKGFVATVSVILISLGLFAFSLSVFGGAFLYSDFIDKKEARMQAEFNIEACIILARDIFEKDNFLRRHFEVSDLGCTADYVSGISNTINLNVVFGGMRVATSTEL